MRDLRIVEIAIVKFDPMLGIQPDSVILPHVWQEGETYLEPDPNAVKAPEKKEESVYEKNFQVVKEKLTDDSKPINLKGNGKNKAKKA